MPADKIKILIVDDERDICEVLKAKFEKAGFDVSMAFDGLEGFQKVLALHPSCVLLDIRMPKEDGLSFLRKVRSFRHDDLDKEEWVRKMPVIVLTGAGEQMRLLFQMEGISDYMEKPYDFDVLRSRILKVLDASAA